MSQHIIEKCVCMFIVYNIYASTRMGQYIYIHIYIYGYVDRSFNRNPIPKSKLTAGERRHPIVELLCNFMCIAYITDLYAISIGSLKF